MKLITYLTTLVLSLSAASAFAGPVFLDLQSDKTSYTVGQKAILTAKIKIQPTNPNDEIVLMGTFGDNAVKISKISEDQAVAVSTTMSTAGNYTWTVNAFIQDKEKVRRYEEIVAYYLIENARINNLILNEKDPAILANLQAQYQRNMAISQDAQRQIYVSKRLIESRTLTVSVADVSQKVNDSNPVIAIDCDVESQAYKVGDTATFFVHALTEFNGPDGVQEIVASGNILADDTHTPLSLEKKRLGDSDYSFVAPAFQATDVGSRVFRGYIQIRSKAQADSIRNTVAMAAKRKAGYIAQMNSTQDPMKKAYFQQLIGDLESTMTELNRQLQDILTTVGPAKDFYFTVNQ